VFCSGFWIVVLAKPNFNKGNVNAGQLKQQKIKNIFQELTFIRNKVDVVECRIHVEMGTSCTSLHQEANHQLESVSVLACTSLHQRKQTTDQNQKEHEVQHLQAIIMHDELRRCQ